MFDFFAVKQKLEQAVALGVLSLGVATTPDLQWVSFHELLAKIGETNASRACRKLCKRYPAYENSFAMMRFPKKPKLTRAIHVSQLEDLIKDFDTLSKLYPKPSPEPEPPPQPELPLPATQPSSKPHTVRLSYPAIPSGSIAFSNIQKAITPPNAPYLKYNTSPFGWFIDGDTILMVPEEAFLATEIEKMYAANQDTIKIANTLNHQKCPTRKNTPWTPLMIQEIADQNRGLWLRWIKYTRTI